MILIPWPKEYVRAVQSISLAVWFLRVKYCHVKGLKKMMKHWFLAMTAFAQTNIRSSDFPQIYKEFTQKDLPEILGIYDKKLSTEPGCSNADALHAYQQQIYYQSLVLLYERVDLSSHGLFQIIQVLKEKMADLKWRHPFWYYRHSGQLKSALGNLNSVKIDLLTVTYNATSELIHYCPSGGKSLNELRTNFDDAFSKLAGKPRVNT